jgi:hypothetical protein
MAIERTRSASACRCRQRAVLAIAIVSRSLMTVAACISSRKPMIDAKFDFYVLSH